MIQSPSACRSMIKFVGNDDNRDGKNQGEGEKATTIKEELGHFIDALIEVSARVSSNLYTIPPQALHEYAHLLSHQSLYEQVIERKIENTQCDKELKRIEVLDKQIERFVHAERKRRTRLKLNYLLAGATSNRLESAIHLLVESDELDSNLDSYIESLVKQELVKTMGPTALLDKSTEERLQQSTDETGKNTVQILRMIQRRLAAQIDKSVNRKDELRLLSMLMSETNIGKRQSILLKSMKKIESLDDFESFVDNGIEYLLEKEIETCDGKTCSSKSKIESISFRAGIVEKMKDVLVDIRAVKVSLKTGLTDENTSFSTKIEDYSGRQPKNRKKDW